MPEIKVGMRLLAKQPSRYIQIADRHTPAVPTGRLGELAMPALDGYWMDIVAVSDTTFTYDSYIERAGFIEPSKVGREAPLHTLLAEIEAGHLLLSPASGPAH